MRKRCTGYAKQASRSTNQAGGAALSFPRHTVNLVTQSEVEGEARLELEVILQKKTEFSLLPGPLPRDSRLKIERAAGGIECLEDVINGSAQVRQQCLCCIFVGPKSRNRGAVDSYDSQKIVTDTKLHARNHIERTKRIAAHEAALATELDLVLALDPVKRIPQYVQRSHATLRIVIVRNGISGKT